MKLVPKLIITAVLTCVLLACVIGAVGKALDNSAPDDPATTTAVPAAKGAPPTRVGLTAGTWKVPNEVKPGTYTTTANDFCYWARLKAFDGELGSVIANGNLEAGQHGRFTIKTGDAGVELQGDCTWHRA